MLQSQVAKGIQTSCKFRVGHSLTLWPLAIASIEHGPFRGVPPKVLGQGVVRSALHLKIENATQSPMSQVHLDALDLHVACGDEYAYTLFERICHKTVRVAIRPAGDNPWTYLPREQIQPLGLNDDEALLPSDATQFSGTRLLQEFFAFPQRFLFFRIQGLKPYLAACNHAAFELAFCFADANIELDRVVDTDSLALNCTPVINLFEHTCDRVLLDEQLHEAHLVPNRSKPQDFEVHSILSVQGHGQNLVQPVPPLYGNTEAHDPDLPRFMSRRVPTQVSQKQVREGGRSSYTGSEVYLGLTLPTGEMLSGHGIQQLAVRTLCTNRDLPLLMPIGQGPSDLVWPGNLPLQSIRFLRGPSRPKAPVHSGQASWQLIEHLSLNYLGLIDQDGAAAITQLLTLHADPAQQAHLHMARAVQGVESQPVVSRIVRQGRPAVVRGLQVVLTVDELAMQGAGVAVLGAVLARYLAAHVSVNSFVQTRVQAEHTGAVFEFPPQSGNRPLL